MKSNRQAKEGSALAVAMVVVVAAGVFGAGLLSLRTASSVEAAKEVTWSQAFWSAEAGLEQARAIAHKQRQAGAREVFPITESRSWTGSTARGRYEVSIEADVTSLHPRYLVTSEGYSQGGARAAVAALISQTNALSVGLFGADELDLQPNQTITSDPPGEASLGSNLRIEFPNNNMTIDGEVIMGASTNGVPASVVNSNSFGGDYVSAGYIDPDPLGAIGGALALQFQAVSVANNNGAVSYIHNGALAFNQHQTASLPAGDYYLSSIDIRGALVVTSGAVRIFLTGSMLMRSTSTLDVDGPSGNFKIFSNSSADITLMPNSEFRGLIYAPYADIEIKPNNTIEGAIWGKTVQLQPQNNATITIDTDLLGYDAFTNLYRLAVSWRQLPRSW